MTYLIGHSEKETAALAKFERKHREHKQDTAIGGQFTYHITPMSIGVQIEVSCNACKKKKDITEYGVW